MAVKTKTPAPLCLQVALRLEARCAHLSALARAEALPGPEDFDPDGSRPAQDSAAIFQDLVGCSQVGLRRSIMTAELKLVSLLLFPYAVGLGIHLVTGFFRSSENGRPRLKSARAWAKILWRVLSCASNLLGPQRKHTQMQVRKDDLNKDYLGMGSLPALF
eukprot:1138506-Pelagomonas_calceolata.AAC.14